MKLIKLDSSDVKALDNIAKTHPPNRFVYPAFGVSLVSFFYFVSAVADSVFLGQPRIPGQAINFAKLVTNLMRVRD